MIGWIVKNHNSKSNHKNGEILASNGLMYSFDSSNQKKEFTDLELRTKVSFSPSSKDTEYDNVIIENVLEENEDPKLHQIHTELQKFLTQPRYLHCFRVSKIARALAEKFDGPVEKAELAGLLHDMAKEQSPEENLRLIQSSELKLASFELSDHAYRHAAAGAVLAEKHFGIKDKEILHAILYHNGRPAMQKLEKIVYLADCVDYGYKHELHTAHEIFGQDNLDLAIFILFTSINQTLTHKRKGTNVITESMMNYMLVQLSNPASAREIIQDTNTSIPDELFDRALEITSQRGLPISSVKNIRELGGCKLHDGKRIRHHMLVRSGRLSDLTANDSQKLLDFGIQTIIDLRTDQEIKEFPDQNITHFRMMHCPLPSIEISDYQKNLLEKYMISPIGEEKTYYLSEYLSCVDMKEMYLHVLTDEQSIESLRKIFHILLDPSCDGFLFHCTSGKDRTGILAALILLALGASNEDIADDYYTSALATFSETEFFAQSLRKQNYSPSYIDEMRYFNGVGMNIAEYIDELLMDRYGSSKNYLKQLLTEEMIQQLKVKYTE